MTTELAKDRVADAPLITLAVFSYNQEEYIREAVDAAFAQTYRPLEIILSDDCSRDGTFTIIEEMASSYRGTARVVLNRNERNLNIGGHVRRIAELASGEIVVMAAGDDISRPDRVAQVVDAFGSNPSWHAVFSDYALMSDEGTELEAHHRCWSGGGAPKLFDLLYGGGGVGAGATYAYRKRVFNWPEKYPATAHREDRLLPWRSFFLGGVGHLPVPLVRYRSSTAGISRDVSAANLPAAKRPEHIEHLKHVLESASRTGLIKASASMRCRLALDSLVRHMNRRDRLAGFAGRFGGVVLAASRLLFARFLIPVQVQRGDSK